MIQYASCVIECAKNGESLLKEFINQFYANAYLHFLTNPYHLKCKYLLSVLNSAVKLTKFPDSTLHGKELQVWRDNFIKLNSEPENSK